MAGKGHREPHVELTVSVEGVVSIDACGCLSAAEVADHLREALAIVEGQTPLAVRRGR